MKDLPNKEDITNKKFIFSSLTILIFILMAALKLFLASNEEIIALNSYFDDLWYVLSASHWLWLANGYNYMTLIHLPIYSIYIALVHLTGIPLRIGTELTFLASGFFFVYALRKIGLSQLFSLVAYALIILNPASFTIFNRTLAQNLYVSLLLLSSAGIILMFANIKTKKFLLYSIISGLFLALSFLTREEGVAILGIIFVIALLISIPFYLITRDWKTTKQRLKIGVLVPIGIIFLFSLTIYTANYYKFGLFATSELNSSSYKKAYSALLKIKPDKIIRYISVTSDARQKAYSISPSFKELKPYLEDHSNIAFSATKSNMGIEDEMAAGWFYWTLRNAVNSAGYKSAKEESDFYKRMANEINTAISDKKIPGRIVFVSFIDPGTFSFLSHGSESFLKIWKVFISTKELPGGYDDLAPSEDLKVFNSMANRRISLIESKEYNSGENSRQESEGAKIKQLTKKIIWSIYGNIILYLTYLGFLSLIILTLYKKIDFKKNIYSVLTILLFTVLSHVLVFTLLDINSWGGDAPPYLFPVMPIYSSFLLILIYQAVEEFKKKIFLKK